MSWSPMVVCSCRTECLARSVTVVIKPFESFWVWTYYNRFPNKHALEQKCTRKPRFGVRLEENKSSPVSLPSTVVWCLLDASFLPSRRPLGVGDSKTCVYERKAESQPAAEVGISVLTFQNSPAPAPETREHRGEALPSSGTFHLFAE